jgi:antitoxin component YwqK of YwqJK toxin-antitoxin module
MIDKQSKKPEGIGRLIRRDGGWFSDRVYKNGLQNGFSRSIWEDGDHSIGQCVNGQLEGVFEYYNLKGELIKHREYSKGELIKEW